MTTKDEKPTLTRQECGRKILEALESIPDGVKEVIKAELDTFKAEIKADIEKLRKELSQRPVKPVPVPSGKKRKRVSDEQYHEAIKYVIDEKMTQCEAEKKCGLPAGALSKGKGKKMLETVIREFADINRRKVSDVVGDDFRYNSTR